MGTFAQDAAAREARRQKQVSDAARVHPLQRPDSQGRIGSTFYTHDGTWRTCEPSWRVLMVQQENVRGCPSAGFPLPGAKSGAASLGASRRPNTAQPRPATASLGESAAAAAAAFRVLSWKDQKPSGFANERSLHVDPQYDDPCRWTRLGIMTKNRGGFVPDKFGDARPRPLSAQERMSRESGGSAFHVESSGYNRGPIVHTSINLTGGHVYKPAPQGEPDEQRKRYPNMDPTDAYHVPMPDEVQGNKLASGYEMNFQARLPPRPDDIQFQQIGIGYIKKPIRVDKYGGLREIDRKVVSHEDDCIIVTEPSGYTRSKGAHTATELQGGFEYQIRTDLNPSQLALRQLEEPLEYTDPHSHKLRAHTRPDSRN